MQKEEHAMPTGLVSARRCKPDLMKKFDQASKGTPPRIQVEELLSRLHRGHNLVDIGIDQRWIIKDGFSDKHLREDWLNESGRGWWRHAQPIEPLLREAFKQAVQGFLAGHGAGKYSRTLDFYWAQDQPVNGRVYCSLTTSGVQITVTIHTPDPPVAASVLSSFPDDPDIIIIETGPDGGVVVSHPPLIPDPDTIAS
jgi:hypothetical protein